MQKEEIFAILGVDETKDERALKNAYRQQLMHTNPEDDPEGFKRLREAYEAACDYAANEEEEEVSEEEQIDHTPSGIWIHRAEELYAKLSLRCDEKLWRELFQDDIYVSLDSNEECQKKLLIFLMNHFNFPDAVWNAISRELQITENAGKLREQFPADFISEAVDQTRGWFYSLMAESTLLFDKAPYKNVIVLGHVQDENGQKMSKSKGNAVDPFEALGQYGADAIRWYFYTNSAPWLPNRFHGKAVQEGQRKFMGTLWNTYAFFVLYANIDNFDATKYTLEYDKLPVMDKWILSKMNTMVKDVDYNLGNYRIPEAARVLQDFVDDLSNWYVRRSRERFWAKGMEQDKINAYMTLYTALVTISKTAAPMVPFMTEEIYQNLVRSIDETAPESIHLCDFPQVEEGFIDKELEAKMDEVLKVVVMGRAARNTANIKNRQPIAKMFVKAEALPEYYQEIIEDELNVKAVEFTDDVRAFTSYTFKPQLKTVGPKYGKQLGNIRKALTELDGNAAMDTLNEKGALAFNFDGAEVVLTREDLLIDMAQTEGYVSEGDNTVTVVLDTNLTPELVEEGFYRELVSKIQTMRKEAGFEVMDHIYVYADNNDTITGIIKKYADQLKSEVLADSITLGQMAGHAKEWNINGETVMLGVAKVTR